MRLELGDDVFVEAIRAFVAANLDSTVEIEDLQDAAEAVSGRDLAEFFEAGTTTEDVPPLPGG